MKSGKAKMVKKKTFAIKLEYESTEYSQILVLGIDAGSKEIGIATRKESGKLIELSHLETKTSEVKKPGKKENTSKQTWSS